MHYRLLDVLAASVGLILLSPVLVPAMLIVWLQDSHSPFYISPRVGKGGRMFRMVKLRSMVINADESEVDSTLQVIPAFPRLDESFADSNSMS